MIWEPNPAIIPALRAEYCHDGGYVPGARGCCDQQTVDTGCDAPDCDGYACLICGAGCDIVDDDGQCAERIRDVVESRWAT